MIDERIASKIDATGLCWEWTGCILSTGYGQVHDPSTNKRVGAHRHVYELRRVVHLTPFDPMTGQPTMKPLCGRSNGIEFNMTSNVPWGQPRCKRCLGVLNRPTPENVEEPK